MNSRLLRKIVWSSSLLLFFTLTAIAQRADRGVVTGLVSDSTHTNVAGAIVKVRNDDTGVVTELTTNEAGAYTSPSLVLGTYTISVEQPTT